MPLDLPQLLQKLGTSVNRKFPTVNEGGCCVYASRVGQQLRRLDLRPKVIVAGYNGIMTTEDIRKLRDGQRHLSLSEWNDRQVYLSHVFVEFTWQGRQWLHDSNHTVVRDPSQGYIGCWFFHDGYLTVPEALLLAADPCGWNETFNRKHIPDLQGKIERFFKDKIFAKSVDSAGR